MNYRKLTTSTLSLSEIGLGTMNFLWTVSKNDAIAVLDAFADKGGNFIDTADIYPQWVPGLKGGEAEEILGYWLKTRRNREKIIISTKVRGRMWNGKTGEGLSRKHIIKACEESLRRLQTDYLDLYLSHWPDPDTPQQETLSAYESLIQQGKVRYIGCSNYSAQELSQMLNTRPSYVCVQAQYNLIARENLETKLLPLLSQNKLGIISYGSLAGGFLAGVYRDKTNLPKNNRAKFIRDYMTEKNMQILKTIDTLAQKYQTTCAAISLAWLLSHPFLSSTLISADSVEQLKEALPAADFVLSDQDVALLIKASS